MTAPLLEKLPVPTNAAELEEILSDKAKIDAMVASGQLAEVITNYTRIVNERDADQAKQIRNEVERVTAEWLKDNGADRISRPDLTGTVDHIRGINPGQARTPLAVYNPEAPGAALDLDFPTMRALFKAIANPSEASDEDTVRLRHSRQVMNSFSSTVPGDGGFLIPEILRSELLRVALATAIVRPRARVVPMDSLRVPFPMLDSTSNVSSVFGGVVAYWTPESAPLTQSSASFGRVVLDAKKLTAYTAVPEELLSDSLISFEPFINEIFPEAVSWYEDIAFIKGTGAPDPLGVLNAANPAIVTVAKQTGQLTATIVWENIIAMYARMLPTSMQRAVWIVTPDAFPQLATMALSVGTGGVPVWIAAMNGPTGADAPPMTLLGRPVIVSEKAPAILGTQGDISLVDFGFYLIGDRQAMTAKRSDDYLFGNDQIAFRVIERVDGRPWLQSPITPQNNGPTLSPFVQLASRP